MQEVDNTDGLTRTKTADSEGQFFLLTVWHRLFTLFYHHVFALLQQLSLRVFVDQSEFFWNDSEVGRRCWETFPRYIKLRDVLLLLHPFNSLFFRTVWVSWYQIGKTSLDLNEARDDGFLGCTGISWTICKQSAPHSRQITSSAPHHRETYCPIFSFISTWLLLDNAPGHDDLSSLDLGIYEARDLA